MEALLERAVGLMRQAGASYGDIRIRRDRTESLAVKNGRPEHIARGESAGLGVRVIVDGAWGFFGTHRLQESALEEAVRQAVAIARASAAAQTEPVRLAPVEPARGRYETPHQTDPLAVALEQKLDLLIRASEAMAGPNVKLAQAFFSAFDTHQHFR